MPDHATTSLPSAAEILDFWFSERARSRWFVVEAAFDDEIRERFGATAAAAAEGRLAEWQDAPEPCLALVLLLDQAPRNIHRGTPRAFAADPRARAAAGQAMERGFDLRLPAERRCFFYLPFEHSEDLADQRRSMALFGAWADIQPEGPLRERACEQIRSVRRHEEIIERFGRFPHRNKSLGRASTPGEIEFLKEPDSSF